MKRLIKQQWMLAVLLLCLGSGASAQDIRPLLQRGQLVLGKHCPQEFRRAPVQMPQKCPDFLLGGFIRSKQAVADSVGTAIVRPYRSSALTTAIPPQGDALLNVLVRTELLPRAKEQLERAILASRTTDPDMGELRPHYAYDADLASDALLIAKGTELIVLPRALLLHPLVQQMTVGSGDLIATFPSRIGSDLKTTLAAKNPVRKFLFSHEDLVNDPQSAKPKPIVTFIDQPTPTSSQHVKALLQETTTTNVGAFTEMSLHDYDGDGEKDFVVVETKFYDNVQKDFSQRVYVLSRLHHGFLVHFIIPFQSSGPLGTDGVIFKSLFRDASTDPAIRERKWKKVFQGFHEIEFRDGDRVLVTRLDAIPLFVSGLLPKG
ncbi:MAG: hypothetical protein WBD31_01005 [Rubripirellula sp.]